MDKSLYLEKNISQQPAIDLLRSMGYTYISSEDCEAQRGSRYHVLLKDILRGQLRRLNRYTFAGAENEFSAANIERAMDDLDEPLTDGLVRASEKIYDALLLGKSYPETVGEGKILSFNLRYIDWEHPENNLFHVTEEFAVDSRDKLHNARPDLVLFLDMPVSAAQKLLCARYGGDETKKDIHESDVAYMERCRDAALYAAQQQGWQVIPCSRDAQPLTVREIGDRVWKVVCEQTDVTVSSDSTGG